MIINFYAPTKWEAYRVALVRPSLRLYVSQILWHQLLLNYQADFFQTCTDDQGGCVDDCKEMIFSCDKFYQSYVPLLLQMLLQQWGHQCPRTHCSFLFIDGLYWFLYQLFEYCFLFIPKMHWTYPEIYKKAQEFLKSLSFNRASLPPRNRSRWMDFTSRFWKR
jgi:hypothetical protein